MRKFAPSVWSVTFAATAVLAGCSEDAPTSELSRDAGFMATPTDAAIRAASANIRPSTLDFGNVPVNERRTRSLEFEGLGDMPFRIESVAVAPSPPAFLLEVPSVLTEDGITVGQTAVLTVSYVPCPDAWQDDMLRPGFNFDDCPTEPASAELTLGDNTPRSIVVIPLTGAPALPPRASVRCGAGCGDASPPIATCQALSFGVVNGGQDDPCDVLVEVRNVPRTLDAAAGRLRVENIDLTVENVSTGALTNGEDVGFTVLEDDSGRPNPSRPLRPSATDPFEVAMPSGATPGAERFWVRFSGTVPGLFRGRASNASGLRLVTNDPDQPLLVVSVLAESGAPDLTVFPSFINFEEDVAVGASGTVRLTVRNDGRATATLRGIDVVEVPIPSDGPATPSRPFSAATDAPLPIALSMLENTEIEVTYRPTGQQDIAALRIFSDDPDEDPLIVEVRGGPTPRLQVDPPSILTFAAQGPAPTIEEVTLCNAGSAPLTITGFGLSVEVPSAGDDFRLDPPCPFPCSTSIELCSPRSAACTDACRSIRLRYANDDDSSVDEATFSIFSTDPGNSEYRLVLRAP